jgi:hypothetical protein
VTEFLFQTPNLSYMGRGQLPIGVLLVTSQMGRRQQEKMYENCIPMKEKNKGKST